MHGSCCLMCRLCRDREQQASASYVIFPDFIKGTAVLQGLDPDQRVRATAQCSWQGALPAVLLTTTRLTLRRPRRQDPSDSKPCMPVNVLGMRGMRVVDAPQQLQLHNCIRLSLEALHSLAVIRTRGRSHWSTLDRRTHARGLPKHI